LFGESGPQVNAGVLWYEQLSQKHLERITESSRAQSRDLAFW